MKTKIITIMAILFTITFQAQAYVLTFDDIGTNVSGTIPDGYGGFNWSKSFDEGIFYYINVPLVIGTLTDSGIFNSLVSGDCVAWPSPYIYEGKGWISSDNPFIFQGVYITSQWRDGLNIQVDGYLNGSLVPGYSTMVTIDTTGPTWSQFDYENIDELRFSASGGTQHNGYEYDYTNFVMDNFTYIPEPATLLLFALGTVLLRKQHS